MGELSGKVAIVTGASKGIGAAIARRFAEAGAAVAVNYASDKTGADRLVEEIKRGGGKALAIQADVAKSADVKRLFAETKTRLGQPSILVNNAGVFSFAPIEAVTEEDVERQFSVNVLGTILASKEAVAAFDGAGGSIINLSTIASVNPVANSVVYSASKAAIDTITRALAVELALKNIRVNAIAPGATETEGTKTMGTQSGDREGHGHGHADGPHGQARRHRQGRPLSRLRPVIVADRRTHFGLGRTAIVRAPRIVTRRQAAPGRPGRAERSQAWLRPCGMDLHPAYGRISAVEVPVEVASRGRLGPSARRHHEWRRKNPDDRSNDRRTVVPPDCYKSRGRARMGRIRG